MRYNFVIFGSESDYYRASYADIDKVDYARYLWRPIDTSNRFKTLLYRVHTSPKLNEKIHLPFQSIWNAASFVNDFKDNKPLCFVFFTGRNREVNNGLVEYLKQKYQGCKTILFYQDLVKKSFLPDVEKMKQKFDLILSFDQGDCQQYELQYYPLVYSAIDIPANETIKKSDVYFVGKAKDRLDTIISAYEKFKEAGLTCDFHIIGVAPENQKYADEIVYQNQMPYVENLQRIRASKCMLEVMQGGGRGYTLRYCEAIMYDKKVITNNQEVETAPFYSDRLIQTFIDADNICPKFVTNEPVTADYSYKDKLSPVRMLSYIDRII